MSQSEDREAQRDAAERRGAEGHRQIAERLRGRGEEYREMGEFDRAREDGGLGR